VLENWRAQVPEQFAFAIKASRRITHMKRLKDCAEETGYLVKTVQVLGRQLGALLFQLPPYLRRDVDRLAAFLELLPVDLPACFEFRHESWLDPSVTDVLTEQNRPLVWVVRHLVPTAVEVDNATTRERVAAEFRDRPPDAVLLNVRRPSGPWRKVAGWCQQHRPPIPVLFHTGASVDPAEVITIVESVIESIEGDLSAVGLKVYADIEALARYINTARAEIAELRPDDINSEHIPAATDELTAIVGATEQATHTIFEAVEGIEALTEKMSPEVAEQVSSAVTSIFEACTRSLFPGRRRPISASA